MKYVSLYMSAFIFCLLPIAVDNNGPRREACNVSLHLFPSSSFLSESGKPGVRSLPILYVASLAVTIACKLSRCLVNIQKVPEYKIVKLLGFIQFQSSDQRRHPALATL